MLFKGNIIALLKLSNSYGSCNGYGYGYGHGNGSGYGYGFGYGYGDGYGSSYDKDNIEASFAAAGCELIEEDCDVSIMRQ